MALMPSPSLGGEGSSRELQKAFPWQSFKGARLAFSCPRPVRDANEQTILAPTLPNLTFAFTTCNAETFSS